MRKVKKSIALTIVLCFFMSLAGIQVFAIEKLNNDEFDTVLEIAIGNGTQEIGYIEFPEGNRGPEDFCIYNDIFFVLDSVNSKIMLYNKDNWVRNIYIPESLYAGKLYVTESKLYVLDLLADCIYIYDYDGNIISTYLLPMDDNIPNSWFIHDMYEDNDNFIIESVNYDKYIYVNNSFNMVNSNYRKATDNDVEYYRNENFLVNEQNKIDLNIIGEYDLGVIGVKSELNPNSISIDVETTIREYNKDGDVEGYALVQSDNWYSSPRRFAQVNEGDTYLMQCLSDKVLIQKVSFNVSYESKISDSITEDTTTQAQTLKTYKTSAYSRSEVMTRAGSMTGIEWTVKAGHKKIRSGYNVTIPSSVGSIGTTVTGIPYCYGGFFGLDANSNSGHTGRFVDKINVNAPDGALYTAGNTNGSTEAYVPYTIGIDCSGYVSSAYGLTSKMGTTGIYTDFKSIAESELQYGDLMCDPGNHVVIFVSRTSDGGYSIFDSSGPVGKAAARTVTSTYLNGYEPLTGW